MAQTLCKHFGTCGGCTFQDVPYLQQLRNKEERIKELLHERKISAPIKPINHWHPWYYRNKMEFTFGTRDGRLVCGMNSRGQRFTIFDLEQCFIFSQDTPEILKAVKNFCRTKGWTAFDKISHKGFLRYLVVRETKLSKVNQLMIGLVTTSQDTFDKEGFLQALAAASFKNKLTSVWHVTSDTWSDAFMPEQKNLLWGEEFIVEEINGLKFNIGIDSFFQVNPAGVSELYRKIVQYAALTGEERVLDLFCGVGSIGLCLAAQAKFVWGVEIGEAIAAAARVNAETNQIKNATFFTSDTRKFLNTQTDFYRGADLLIINPPRSGLNPKLIRALLRLDAKRIVYSSCNPETMFTDIKDLSLVYDPQFFEPFDFFPHTRHVECLTLLVKKNP